MVRPPHTNEHVSQAHPAADPDGPSGEFCRVCATALPDGACMCPMCGWTGETEQTSLWQASEILACLVLCMPVVALGYMLGYVMWLTVFEHPGRHLFLTCLATMMSTAVAVAVGIAGLRFEVQADTRRTAREATGWFFFTLLLWPVALPLYFLQRRRRGYPDRVRLSIVVVLLFYFGFVATNMQTRSRNASAMETLKGEMVKRGGQRR